MEVAKIAVQGYTISSTAESNLAHTQIKNCPMIPECIAYAEGLWGANGGTIMIKLMFG